MSGAISPKFQRSRPDDPLGDLVAPIALCDGRFRRTHGGAELPISSLGRPYWGRVVNEKSLY
jgi:hypothetical protein